MVLVDSARRILVGGIVHAGAWILLRGVNHLGEVSLAADLLGVRHLLRSLLVAHLAVLGQFVEAVAACLGGALKALVL